MTAGVDNEGLPALIERRYSPATEVFTQTPWQRAKANFITGPYMSTPRGGVMSSFDCHLSASKFWESPVKGCFRRRARKRLASLAFVGACVLAAGFSTRAQAQFQGTLPDNGEFLRESCRVPQDRPTAREGNRAGGHRGSGQDHILLLHRRQSRARNPRNRLHVSWLGSGSVLG